MKKKWLIVFGLCLVMLVACACVASAAPKQPKLVLPKTFKITAGFGDTITVTGMSDGSALPEDVVYTIAPKKAAFATVDPATGAVQTKKAGSVTLTASSATLGKKASATCTIKILANEYKLAKPYKGNGTRDVFPSTKRLYYQNGQLKGEMWLYNRYFTYSLEGIRTHSGAGLLVGLLDRDGNPVVTTVLANQIKFKKRVPMNSAGVIKIAFPASQTPLIDLRNEDVVLAFGNITDIYTFGKSYKGIESKGTLSMK